MTNKKKFGYSKIILPDGEIMYLGKNSLYKSIKKGLILQKIYNRRLKIRWQN